MIDFFNRLYSLAFNKSTLLEKLRINSLARFTTRKIANGVLPCWITSTTNYIQGKNASKAIADQKVIVSLTSFPKRIPKLWMVIDILLRQTRRPDKILLYLSREQFPDERGDLPQSLLRYEGGIFQIVFVDGDLRSHKKYYYVMRDYPDDLVITVDDDIFYPTTLIQTLLHYHEKYPDAIIGRYARILEWTDSGNVVTSTQWKHLRESKEVNGPWFFGTGGGTLFPVPQKKLYKDLLDIELARTLCPIEDDLWLNTMARLQGTPIFIIKDCKDILPIQIRENTKLFSQNGGEVNMTDHQLNQVISYYNVQGLTPYAKPRITI